MQMQGKKMPCYCGHDCARCMTYRASIENNDELRKQSQKFYKEEFGKDILLEQIRCMGGRTDGVFHLCINACSECPGYPCPPLADYINKYVNKCNQVD